MADLYKDVIKSIYQALTGDSTLTQLVGSRIYTNIPDNSQYPLCHIQVDSGDYSGKDFTGQDHAITIVIYSRKTNVVEVSDIRSAIYNILNRSENSLTIDNGHISRVDYDGGDIAKMGDGVTWQGVIQFSMATTGG